MTGMHFSAPRRELIAAVRWASTAVLPRATIPAHAGVLIDVTPGSITITGAGFDGMSRSALAAKISGTGREVVPARGMLAALRSMPGGAGTPVTVQGAGDQLTITAHNETGTVALIPDGPGLFPEIPELPELAGTSDITAFAVIAANAARVAGTDATLPILQSVRLETGDDGLTVIATDRYRLVMDACPWTPAVPGAAGMAANVPAKALTAFLRACGKKGVIAIHIDNSGFAGFANDAGTRTLIARTYTGEFPRIGALLRDAHVSQVTVDSPALQDALNRAALPPEHEQAIPVILAFDRTRGEVTVSGTAENSVPPQTLTCYGQPPDAAIGFDPRMLSSVLAGVPRGEARLAWGKDPAGNTTDVTPAGGGTYRALVMPMKLQGRKAAS